MSSERTRPSDFNDAIRAAHDESCSLMSEVGMTRFRLEQLNYRLGNSVGRCEGMKDVQEAWHAERRAEADMEDAHWRRGYDDAVRDAVAFMQKHNRKSLKWVRDAIEDGKHMGAFDGFGDDHD